MSAGTLAAIILSGAVGVSLGALGVGNSYGSGPRVRCCDPGPASDSTLVDRRRATSIIGAVAHYWRGNNNVNGGLLFGVSGIAGSFLGSYLTDFFSDHPLLGVFAALMVIVGFAMLRQRIEPGYGTRCSVGFAY
ncbi:MAG TPA: sulfite exporter TauE/SafE family protein [Candidatus Binatia bacterium]